MVELAAVWHVNSILPPVFTSPCIQAASVEQMRQRPVTGRDTHYAYHWQEYPVCQSLAGIASMHMHSLR
jgi:hypothetical protein